MELKILKFVALLRNNRNLVAFKPRRGEMTKRLFVAGVDEAGCGPLAGPVTAACIVLPASYHNPKVTDSKQLSEKERSGLYAELCEVALAYSVVHVGHHRVDALNIRRAAGEAHKLAIARVYRTLSQTSKPQLTVLADGNQKLMFCSELHISYEPVVKGDSLIQVIAAASILAKVSRDRLMHNLAQRYPGYGLERHMGYPTKSHKERIATLGPCTIHRRTFRGVKEYTPTFETGQT